MKAVAILVIILLVMPFAAGEVPDEVQNFCINLDQDDCNNYSYWFEHGDCKSQIRCNVIIDLDNGFSFKGCDTVLRFVLDDCENNPSSLCFNNIAYDISQSRTCDCGGVKFKRIDGCGNPLEWGDCIDMDSCKDVTKVPHEGAAIVVKEDCEIVEQDCSGPTEYQTDRPWMVAMDNPDEEDEEESEEDEDEEEEQADIPEPVLIQEPVETQSEETPEEVAVEKNPVPKVIIDTKESGPNIVVMILMGVVALLFLVVLISWVYVSYFKK